MIQQRIRFHVIDEPTGGIVATIFVWGEEGYNLLAQQIKAYSEIDPPKSIEDAVLWAKFRNIHAVTEELYTDTYSSLRFEKDYEMELAA